MDVPISAVRRKNNFAVCEKYLQGKLKLFDRITDMGDC